MVYSEMKFRTAPSYYSRADVERTVSGRLSVERFMKTMEFAMERFNRGRETIRMDIDTSGDGRSARQVSFYLAGRRENAEIGELHGDLLTIEGLCYDAGTRHDFLQVLPRLSRLLIEKEYRPAMTR